MTQTQKNFLKGAAILGIAGLIVKIIGAIFRIPLSNVIGGEGLGYYQLAYPTYQLLLMVSTAGLPVAVSKLVSERIARGDFAGAHNTFRVARRVLVILGIVMSVLMFALSGFISELKQTPEAVYSIAAVAPALFFVAVMSSYRGYFQGLQYMVPTAVSQLIEQLIKLAVGLSLAYALLIYTGRPELGAMGAILGMVVSEAVALFYIMWMYRKKRGELEGKNMQIALKGPIANFKPILKKVILIAIPVTLGACVMPIVSEIDTYIVPGALQALGYSSVQATEMFGVLTGNVNPLINMPAVLSLALCMSLVPAVSQSVAQGDIANVKSKSSLGFKLALLVGLPATTGFILLAKPIISMLYKNVVIEGNLEMATLLLQLMSFGVLFLTIIQTLTGVLQGLGKPALPVISLAVGATIKVVVSITLISQPQINIYGAAIGTIACYMAAAIIDVVFVLKHSGFKLSLLNHILKPLLATAAMGVCVYFVYELVGGYSNTLGVVAAIIVAMLVYCAVLLISGGLNKEELESIPGGGKITRVMQKLKIWK